MILFLFACSEQSNQTFENADPHVNQEGHATSEGEVPLPGKNDKARVDLIIALKETKMALKESEILLRRVPRGKESDSPLKALEEELQTAESNLIEVWKTIEQGDYLKAKAEVNKITDRTNLVNQQIKQAIRKQARGR